MDDFLGRGGVNRGSKISQKGRATFKLNSMTAKFALTSITYTKPNWWGCLEKNLKFRHLSDILQSKQAHILYSSFGTISKKEKGAEKGRTGARKAPSGSMPG